MVVKELKFLSVKISTLQDNKIRPFTSRLANLDVLDVTFGIWVKMDFQSLKVDKHTLSHNPEML